MLCTLFRCFKVFLLQEWLLNVLQTLDKYIRGDDVSSKVGFQMLTITMKSVQYPTLSSMRFIISSKYITTGYPISSLTWSEGLENLI